MTPKLITEKFELNICAIPGEMYELPRNTRLGTPIKNQGPIIAMYMGFYEENPNLGGSPESRTHHFLCGDEFVHCADAGLFFIKPAEIST